MYYTVCYFTGIFYAVVRHISMLFIDNKDSVFCSGHSVALYSADALIPSSELRSCVKVEVASLGSRL